jgi:hypothetical protein
MTKIFRKKEWEQQQLRHDLEDCISLPKGLILNKSKNDNNNNKLTRKNKEDTKKKN